LLKGKLLGVFTPYLIGAGALLVTFLFVSYNQLKADLKAAEDTIVALEYSAEAARVVQEAQDAFNEESKVQLATLNVDLIKQTKYSNDLRSKLQKHNLTNLAAKKPVLIQKRINDASNKIIADIIASTNR